MLQSSFAFVYVEIAEVFNFLYFLCKHTEFRDRERDRERERLIFLCNPRR